MTSSVHCNPMSTGGLIDQPCCYNVPQGEHEAFVWKKLEAVAVALLCQAFQAETRFGQRGEQPDKLKPVSQYSIDVILW